jgi:hypothetical protein
MSRLKHKKRASGGKADVYAGGDSNVLKEAMERKRGGKVEHMEGEGEMAKERHDRPKRAKGGKAEHHEKHRAKGGKAEHHEKHRAKGGNAEHHEKHRAKGGRVKGEGVGANRTPLSTAAKISEVTPGEQAEDANED